MIKEAVMNKAVSLENMKSKLEEGSVYRRSEFEDLTSNVDRNLARLVKEGHLKKVQNGLYHCPRNTPFGEAPPNESELLSKFLNDDHFVVYSPSMFNSLGLGTTQLYNKVVVFNRKRHGEMKLGGKTYYFHRWREAPKELTKEFLLVEMLNRLNTLAEDRNFVLENLEKKLGEFNLLKLYKALNRFGRKSTDMLLRPMLEQSSHVSASS